MKWAQGEHVALIGPTGTGKTTLAETLLSQRKYVVALLTKSDTLAWRKFRTETSAGSLIWAKSAPDGAVRIILKPSPEKRADEFRKAIKLAYKQGGWTIYFDELYELQTLGLEPEIIQQYSEGRSEGITCVGGMQRPAWVTRKGVSRWAISQVRHVFGFRMTDQRDVEIVAEIVGKGWARQLPHIRRFEFAYLNQTTGKTATGNVKTLSEVF